MKARKPQFGESPGVFPQNWLPPQLSYTGLLEVKGVRFDVIVRSLFCAVKSVDFGAEPVVSNDTEDGDRIPMTTSTHSWGGESGCSEWLREPVTGSLLHVVLACRLAVLSDCSSCDCLHVSRFCADSLLQFVCVVGGVHRTVLQDYFVDAMATGNSQPEVDRKGIDFRVHVQIPWNAPESFVTLDSPGCLFVSDTACVPDVLGLTRCPDAEPVKVLQGRAQKSV